MFDDSSPPIPTAEKIVEDMEARKDTIRFDLTEDYWKENPEEFWEKFRHTDEILVPHRFEDWIVGQEEAVEKLRLNLIEWPRKLRDLTALAERERPVSQILRERPGPYVLLLGEPGTGKSLLIKVAAEYLEELYKREGIELYDVLAVKNPSDDYAPLIRYARAGDGRKIQSAANKLPKKGNIRDSAIKEFLLFLVIMGAMFIASGMFLWVYISFQDPTYAWWVANSLWQGWLLIGVFMCVFPILILVIWRMRLGTAGIMSGKSDTPSILVDNHEPKYWVDATVGNAPLMFGDVEWDPYGRSKSGHQRIKAGDVHRADRKLLYIDEVKNLSEKMAVELLTVMEDGATEIKGHEGGGTSHTASQTVRTSSKVSCIFFLIMAGNMDILDDPMSVLNRVAAFRDRIEGYGDIIVMKDEMENSPTTRLKIAQVMADEIYRFNFPPATRDAVTEIISLMARGASSNRKLRMRFRRVIGILRRAAQFAWDESDQFIRPEHVDRAIEFNVPAEEAVIREHIEKNSDYKIMYKEGERLGIVNGLAVWSRGNPDYMAGDVIPVAAWMNKVDDSKRAEFIVTGINQEENTWVSDSIRAVRTSIYRMYGIDLAKDYYVHVSFLQNRGVDGPSAGTTMTLAIMSILEEKPIRQDIAVTGTVEVVATGEGEDVRVGPIGGAWQKALGAKRYGLRAVIVPKENFENTLDKTIQRKIRVVPARTVREYFSILTSPPEEDTPWSTHSPS